MRMCFRCFSKFKFPSPGEVLPNLGLVAWVECPGCCTLNCPSAVGCVEAGVVEEVLGEDLLGGCGWDCGTVLRMVRVAGMTVVKVLEEGRTGMVGPGLTCAIWEKTWGTPTVGFTNWVPGALEEGNKKQKTGWVSSWHFLLKVYDWVTKSISILCFQINLF